MSELNRPLTAAALGLSGFDDKPRYSLKAIKRILTNDGLPLPSQGVPSLLSAGASPERSVIKHAPVCSINRVRSISFRVVGLSLDCQSRSRESERHCVNKCGVITGVSQMSLQSHGFRNPSAPSPLPCPRAFGEQTRHTGT